MKPGNVLLDEEGNAYLTDFGVALDAGSPEKTHGHDDAWDPGVPVARADPSRPGDPAVRRLRARASCCTRCSPATHPFPETSLTALLDRHLRRPAALASRGTARPASPPRGRRDRPRDREGRSRAVRRRRSSSRPRSARRSRDRRAPAAPVGEIRNPYKGLRAFLEADAGDFFGREEVTDRLVRTARRAGRRGARFLAVVGPSGSGKSSVVRAGLVPALRRGAHPRLRPLVRDRRAARGRTRCASSSRRSSASRSSPPPSLLEELERDELGLVRAADARAPRPRRRARDRARSARGGLHARRRTRTSAPTCSRASGRRPSSRTAGSASSPRCAPTSTTSRCRCAASATCWPRGPRRSRRCRPRSSSARSSPLPTAPGLTVEPTLLAAMIADVVDRPGALPLLQYALTELAERAEDGVLTLETYRQIGGVSGALARRAEQLYEATERGRARRVPTAVPPARDARRGQRGHATAGPSLRARCRSPTRGRWTASSSRSAATGCSRSTAIPTSREPTVEIAHEALLECVGAAQRLDRRGARRHPDGEPIRPRPPTSGRRAAASRASCSTGRSSSRPRNGRPVPRWL